MPLVPRHAEAEDPLALAGHTVIEADGGATAIRALRDSGEAMDAVVLDYRLSDSNDLTQLATVRQLSPKSAIVMMTAFGTPEIVEAALELGVYEVFHKPFEMRDLQLLLEEACSTGGV